VKLSSLEAIFAALQEAEARYLVVGGLRHRAWLCSLDQGFGFGFGFVIGLATSHLDRTESLAIADIPALLDFANPSCGMTGWKIVT